MGQRLGLFLGGLCWLGKRPFVTPPLDYSSPLRQKLRLCSTKSTQPQSQFPPSMIFQTMTFQPPDLQTSRLLLPPHTRKRVKCCKQKTIEGNQCQLLFLEPGGKLSQTVARRHKQPLAATVERLCLWSQYGTSATFRSFLFRFFRWRRGKQHGAAPIVKSCSCGESELFLPQRPQREKRGLA